jgi:signal peptidase I
MSEEILEDETPETPEVVDAAENGEATEDQAPAEKLTAWQYLWREWIKPIAPVVIVLLAFRSSVSDWNDVPTGSMKPNIIEGDRIYR